MTRPTWEELPDVVINAVQAQCGQVLKAETATHGIMPGIATRLDLEDGGHVFFKAIERTHEAARLHLRERWAGRSLPTEVPAPRMLWADTVGDWHAMVWEYVNDKAHHADLSPGSEDLPAVLDTMALLGALFTPCPNGAMPVSENVNALMAKARHMLDKPPGELAERAPYEAAVNGFDLSALRGNTLLHYDLSAGNLLVTGGRVRVVDWSFAARGAAWLDAALFAPRLIDAGHTPEKTDQLLSTLPHWRDAPRKAVAGIAAAWTLFRLYKAQYGPEQVREARARAADAGRSWLAYQQANA
ncbi:phosphotransferase [Nonomuraea sp. NBC_00507]|uniref:phosphotransferase family protein n=1 Tax=Nonomuraea sp. NBC_00507 TaxID=2976002 RepID=UPI002E19BD73